MKKKKKEKCLQPVKYEEFRWIGKVCFCFAAQYLFTLHFITNNKFEVPFVRQTVIKRKPTSI